MADSQEDPRPTVSALLSSPRSDILSILGNVYEHSQWVAVQFCDTTLSDNQRSSKIETVTDLTNTLRQIVDESSDEQKLELLKSHPDLCEKVSTTTTTTTLTKHSQEEQSSAGLDTLTDTERTKFLQLNDTYKDKFGFPFILAVRNATKYTVLSSIEGRISNSKEREFVTALTQVHKIARMRVMKAIRVKEPKGFLTCHVLDTANGCPAANMRIQLHRRSPPEHAGFVGEFVTNSDGRLSSGPALKGSNFIVGTYEWTFYVADYFAGMAVETSCTPFLDIVPLRFGMDDPDEHYHVPLLVSPWSFSTYRGS